MLEQLWYTSSAVGLEGGGLQVRAASPGLADLGTAVATAAKRLCHFTPPPASLGLAPVSFGWADLRTIRFVFRRCTAGLDSLGRPQVFSHVVAGPAADLPPRFVAERFASPFWRSDDGGHGDSVSLPRITPADIGAGTIARLEDSLVTACLQAFVQARADRRRLVFVTDDSALVAALVYELATLLPVEAFEGVRSFSTYEPQDSAQAYAVAGVLTALEVPSGSVMFDPASHPEQRVSSRVGRLAQTLRAGAHAVAVQAASTAEGFRFDVLTTATEALEALGGEGVPPIDDLLPLLRSVEGTLVVVRSPVGRTSMAAAALVGHSEVWRALGLAAAALQPDDLRLLGREIGIAAGEELAVGRHGALHRALGSAGAYSAQLAEAITEAVVARTADDPHVLERLSENDRLALVQAVAHHGIAVPAPRVAAMLRCAPATAERIAALQGLSPAWRAQVSAHGLLQSTDGRTLRSYAAALTGDRRLLVDSMAVARTLPDAFDAVSAVVGTARIDVAKAFVAAAVDARWPAGDVATLQLTYVDRPDINDPLAALSSWLGQPVSGRGRVRVAPVVIERYRFLLANDLLARATGEGRPVRLTQLDQRIVARFADHPRQSTAQWQLLFERLNGAARKTSLDSALRSVREPIVSMPVGYERDAAVAWALDVLLLLCRSPADFDELRDFLGRWLGRDVGEWGRRLAKSVRRQSDIGSKPAVEVLVWFLYAIAREELTARGPIAVRLADDELQRRASGLAAMADGHGLVRVDKEAQGLGGKAARWWRGLRPDGPPAPTRTPRRSRA